MEPIRINRGQILSMWTVASGFPVDVQMRIFEQRGDDEIWLEAESDLGKGIYRFPASGGSSRVDSNVEGPEARLGGDSEGQPLDVVSEAKVARDDPTIT